MLGPLGIRGIGEARAVRRAGANSLPPIRDPRPVFPHAVERQFVQALDQGRHGRVGEGIPVAGQPLVFPERALHVREHPGQAFGRQREIRAVIALFDDRPAACPIIRPGNPLDMGFQLLRGHFQKFRPHGDRVGERADERQAFVGPLHPPPGARRSKRSADFQRRAVKGIVDVVQYHRAFEDDLAVVDQGRHHALRVELAIRLGAEVIPGNGMSVVIQLLFRKRQAGFQPAGRAMKEV